MGRYCSCSGAAANPVHCQSLAFLMDPVLHVFIRYENVLRCTPATTATTSFMEWSGHVWQRSLVCSPAADLDESNLDAPSTYHRLSSFIAVDLQVGDYRWPDGREYRGT